MFYGCINIPCTSPTKEMARAWPGLYPPHIDIILVVLTCCYLSTILLTLQRSSEET